MAFAMHRAIDPADPMEVSAEERACAELPDAQGNTVNTLVERCSQFTADTRFRIGYALLQQSPRCVKDLTAMLTEKQPTISHHLKALSLGGFVMDEKKGKHHLFRPSQRMREFLFPLFAAGDQLTNISPEEFEFPDLTPDERRRHRETLILIAHEHRLRIGLRLAHVGEARVKDICNFLQSRQPGVSHHIGVLQRKEFLFGRRDGKYTHYRMTRKFFAILQALCRKEGSDGYDDA